MTDAWDIPSDQQQVISDTDDTNPDPRHQHRIALMQALFSYSFGQPPDLESEALTEYHQIVAHIDELDADIQQFAPERPLHDINQVDLAILRLIVHEARYVHTPVKVLINEAVELAKEFGTDSSPRFVNGVLGQLLT